MTDLTNEARALVDAARAAERPPPGAKQRVQAAILASIATGAAEASAATGGAAAGAKVAGTSLTLKLIAPLALVALGLGGAWVAGAFDRGSPAPGPAAAAAPAAVPAAAPAPVLAAVPEPAPPQPEIAALAPEPAPTPAVTKPRATKSKPPAPAPSAPAPLTIRAELELMRAAQTALTADDAARALAIVRDHADRFPNGQLVQEREAARVHALCALDRVDDATAAAARFLKRWPKSPQAARVRNSCVEDTLP